MELGKLKKSISIDSHPPFPISAHAVSGSGSCLRVKIENMIEPKKEQLAMPVNTQLRIS